MKWIRHLKNNLDFQDLWRKYSAVILIVVLVVMFNLFGKGFQNLQNYQNIVLSNTGMIITVIGLSFVMIGGGIDLSIGYQISLIAVVISLLSVQRLPDWVVIVAALATGICCGLLNGFLVGYMKIVPFAATIATQIIFRGLSFVLSDGSMVSHIAPQIRQITRTSFLGIRVDLWLLAASVLVLWFVLRRTYIGKYLRAIGLNEEAAVRAKIKVKMVKCLSYCAASVFYTIAAMIFVSKRGYAGSEIGVGMEITAIVAAYVGGILTMAEKQGIMTLLLGTLVVAVIENGLTKVALNTSVQYIITGVILIISMVLNRKKKSQS